MKKGVMLVLFTALISGVSIFINQFGVKGINSTLFTFSKNVIVSVFLLAIIIGVKEFSHLRKLSLKDWRNLALIGLIGGSIPFVLFFKGLQLSNGAVGSFIHKTMFILVAVLAMIFLKEKLSAKIIIPAVLLLVGNFLLLKINSFDFGFGSLLVLIATIFWAVENTISKRLLFTIEPRILAFGRMFFGSLFIMVYMLVAGISFGITMPQLSWILLSSAFLLLYLITWYSGLKEIKVTTATAILLLGSPITTLLSLFTGSALNIAQAFGALAVVCGAIFMISFAEKESYPTISTA